MDSKPKAPTGKIVLIAAIVISIIVLLAAYFFFASGKKDRTTAQKKAEKSVEYIVPAAPTAATSPDVPDAAQDKSSETVRRPAVKDVCKEHRARLHYLFSYLDKKAYIQSRQLPGGSMHYLKGVGERLLDVPPSVPLETDSLLKILRNRAHFYRTLGKKDTLLLRDILKNEDDMAESLFAALYQSFTLRKRCSADDVMFDVPLEKLYPYAVFFLDTLGGSSYLMRRDLRTRILARYYCILVIDQANRNKRNRLGLNIIPHRDMLMRDIKNANLTGKEKYLKTLREIRSRY